MEDEVTSKESVEIRRKQIILLVETYYHKFSFLQKEKLDELKQKALDMYLDSNLTIDEINDELLKIIYERGKEHKKKTDKEYISNNHKEIYSKLDQLVNLMNKEGIDYQLAGALSAYIKYNTESDRYHEDIDFNINENDIDKFKKICQSLGLYFEDNRLSSPRILNNGIPSGEHEVIAKESNSNFHVGVFCFERVADGSVITKGYYHDDNNNSCVREDIFSPELAKLIFSGESVELNGKKIIVTPPEYIYLLKNYTKSEKDLQDIRFLEDKLDEEKLNKISTLLKTDSYTQNIPVNSLPSTYDNPFNNISDNNELDRMLDSKDEDKNTKEDTNSKTNDLGKQKVLTKVSNDFKDQSGYASTNSLTSITLISYVLIFILIVVFMIIMM